LNGHAASRYPSLSVGGVRYPTIGIHPPACPV